MSLARTGLERLLLLLFGALRNVFLVQGVALAVAWMATCAAAPAEPPAWLRAASLSALLLSLTFFVAGLLLVAARSWRVPHVACEPHAAGWPWPAVLGLSLLVLPAVAAGAGSGLPSLWCEIGVRLDAIGFWDSLSRPDPFGGIVLLPLLLALLVPALVSAAAAFSIAVPLLLLLLLPARSRLFPTLLALAVVCQGALVLGGWLAADGLARLAEQASGAMNVAGDAEVTQVAQQLQRWTGVLTAAAGALVPPLLGMLAWLAFLRPTGPAAAWFTEGASPPAAPAWRPERAGPTPPRTAIPGDQSGPAARPPGVKPAPGPRLSARRARLGLALLGASLLLFGAADALRTRPGYLSSEPAPGVTLAAPPTTLRVRFAAPLHPASSLSLTKLVLPPQTGEQPREIELSSGLAAHDPEQRTLEGTLPPLPAGVYRVSWHALPARGGVSRHGSYSFGVGLAVPEDGSGDVYSLQDRDAGERGRRKTFAGGALLLGIGLLFPFAPRR